MKKIDAYRLFLILSASVSLLFGMIFAASSIYQVTVAKLSALELVLVGTTLELSVFLFEVPTGVVADIKSRRLSIIIGYVLIGMGFILEGSIPRFGTILIGQALWGIGYTFTSGATQAWISDEIGEERAAGTFLRASQVGSISGLAGLALGVIIGRQQVNIPVILGGLLLVGLAAFLTIFMPETGFKPVPRGERSNWQHMLDTFKDGMRAVRSRPLLLDILWIGFYYGLYSEGFDRLWTKHMLDNFTLPVLAGFTPMVWNGLIRAGQAVLGTLAIEVVHRNIDTGKFRHLLVTMFAVTATLAVALFAFAQMGDSFLLMVLALWVISVSRQVIEPLYTTWVNQKLDSQVRATVISMSSQVDAIGQISGGPVVGLIGQRFSIRVALTASSLLLLPNLALFVRSGRHHEVEQRASLSTPEI
jgi:DHA3 family tetracycline resistance protein-like MFS transporter